MDDFEKQYFAKLKQLSTDYTDQRSDLAKSRIKMFAAALTRQLFDQNEKFDLLVGAGNSGLFMTEIAKLVFANLKLPIPPTICLPIYRFKEVDGEATLNDNSALESLIADKLNDLPSDANILFVDDEIMAGITIYEALKLLLSVAPRLDSIHCLVIAEHHFFEWHYQIPKVTLNFFAYSRLIQGLNGNIGYFIPDGLFAQISGLVTDVESRNHAAAIVIGGALKRQNDQGEPFYDHEPVNLCQHHIVDYQYIKQTLLAELKRLVDQGVSDYQQQKIQFRF